MISRRLARGAPFRKTHMVLRSEAVDHVVRWVTPSGGPDRIVIVSLPIALRDTVWTIGRTTG
jgi:hypothetical protein